MLAVACLSQKPAESSPGKECGQCRQEPGGAGGGGVLGFRSRVGGGSGSNSIQVQDWVLGVSYEVEKLKPMPSGSWAIIKFLVLNAKLPRNLKHPCLKPRSFSSEAARPKPKAVNLKSQARNPKSETQNIPRGLIETHRTLMVM